MNAFKMNLVSPFSQGSPLIFWYHPSPWAGQVPGNPLLEVLLCSLSLLYHLAYLQSWEFLTLQGLLRGDSAEAFPITCK